MRGAVSGLAVVLLTLTACTSGASDEPAAPSAPPASRSALPQGGEKVSLDPSEFSTTGDNPFFPLRPRTQWHYRETGDEGTYDVLVTVTTVTERLADGVKARVVRDTVRQGGEIVEDTFDWYAEDRHGNVWYLGEDTVELADGRASHEGSFEAGKDGAQAGVIMPGDPQPGDVYRQEHLAGEAEDVGAVLATSKMVDVPAGHFEGALLTEDTSTLEPGVSEYKLYAPGVGLVLTLGVSGGASREELLEVRRVSAAEAREEGTRPLGRD